VPVIGRVSRGGTGSSSPPSSSGESSELEPMSSRFKSLVQLVRAGRRGRLHRGADRATLKPLVSEKSIVTLRNAIIVAPAGKFPIDHCEISP
jgi:hypothetical protein